jgi:hypothetical protein
MINGALLGQKVFRHTAVHLTNALSVVVTGAARRAMWMNLF